MSDRGTEVALGTERGDTARFPLCWPFHNSQNLSPAGRFPGPNESAAVFSLPFWPFQVNSRIESQLRSYRESEAILVFRGNVTMLLPF